MKRVSEGNPLADKRAAKATKVTAPATTAKQRKATTTTRTVAPAQGGEEPATAKKKRASTKRDSTKTPMGVVSVTLPVIFELVAPLPALPTARKRARKPLLEFIAPRPGDLDIAPLARLIVAGTPLDFTPFVEEKMPLTATTASYSQEVGRVDELPAAELVPTAPSTDARTATAKHESFDGAAPAESIPETHVARPSIAYAPSARDRSTQKSIAQPSPVEAAQPLGADVEPNLFSEEASKASVVKSLSRITEAEDEAAAFWRSPDVVPPRTYVAAPATESLRTPSAIATPAAYPIAQPVDDSRGGRRRHRRRRKGGQAVLTEHPIDTPAMASVVQKLRRQFGLHSFRPGQERIIRNVLAGVDTLAVMPTGSGKSLTFQLPAMVLDGVTVVVSPLLALMKDQTDKLRRRGVVAARLDSTLTKADERHTLQMIDEGQRKLIYVTPERAGSADFKSELSGQKVSLFVIDEAHCVSQWGHDFRPAYLNLKHALEELDNPPVLALTATATPRVIDDIKDRLDMPQAELVHTGFARPELAFEVRTVPDETAQIKRLLRLIRRLRGSGIVYCSTIASVEMLAKGLPRIGIRAGMYHGKMTKLERDAEQQSFMGGQTRLMIATNAFGLGVDKQDIRFVIHYNLPGSVEAYYQEAGRAGRDGRSARCILLWRSGDEEVQEHFVAQKYPGRDQVRQVAYALTTGPGKVTDIALRAGVPQKKTQVVLAMLEEGNLAKQIAGAIWTPVEEVADEQVVWNAAEAYRKKRESDRERLQAMLDYAETRRCRVQFLLEYFVEEVEPCGKCDNCTGRNAAVDDEEDEPEVAEPLRPRVETPALPPPPRKDPTTMF